MEILAPAGSKESFVAAVEAGADSVYVGLDDFNARKSAPNLDLRDLAVLTEYAHSKKVKVYLVLNILIKHEEISDAVNMLAQAVRAGVDAVIVQDLGLARIIKDFFPGLRLHASTQLACHNSAGAGVLAELGFDRVVLARELTFAEIKLITAANKNIEYEIFAHGALCFCVSGMCLFSSFLTGLSGNRGRCSQPCRRIWHGKKASGYLFSPKDLELIDHLGKLRGTGVTSIKIEGRMRSSEYVHRAVSQYKTGKKGEDLGRRKTACLFSGRDENLFEPEKEQCLGIKIGEFPHFRAKTGDRVRVVDPRTDRSCIFKYGVEKPDLKGFKKGDPVYLSGSKDFDGDAISKKLAAIYAAHRKRAAGPAAADNRYTSLISRGWPRPERKKEKLWFRIDDAGWTRLLPAGNVVFAVNPDNMLRVPAGAAVELPPFIAERDLPGYRNIRAAAYVLNNVAHFDLVPRGAVKIAGQFLYAWNAYTARALKDLGVSRFFTSWEDDVHNIQRLKFPLVATLFGRPVLTRSRMLTKEHDYGTVVSGNKGPELEQVMEGGLSLLVSRAPVMLFNAKNKLRSAGVNDFCIDLSRFRPDKRLLEDLLAAYSSGRNLDPSHGFNFWKGVK